MRISGFIRCQADAYLLMVLASAAALSLLSDVNARVMRSYRYPSVTRLGALFGHEARPSSMIASNTFASTPFLLHARFHG
jgi:hypothetical protein